MEQYDEAPLAEPSIDAVLPEDGVSTTTTSEPTPAEPPAPAVAEVKEEAINTAVAAEEEVVSVKSKVIVLRFFFGMRLNLLKVFLLLNIKIK